MVLTEDAADSRSGLPLSGSDSAYLAQIRGALKRIGRRSDPDDDGVASALADVEDAATIDVEVPTTSNRRVGRTVKEVVKRLTGWYLRYVAQQTTVLGQATLRLGTALSRQADRLDDTVNGLVDEVAGLRERVERLERGSDEGGVKSE